MGSVLLMAADDDTWRALTEPHERLRWARERWQKGTGTATDAARALGMKAGTYRALERAPGSSKTIRLNHQTAAHCAKKFKVSWVWLLLGTGTPFDDQVSGHVERAVRALADLDEDAQKAIADMAEQLTRRTGTKG